MQTSVGNVGRVPPSPPPDLAERAPAEPPPLVLRDCGAQPPRLLHELAHVTVERPAARTPHQLPLPAGMTLPPRATPSDARCAPVGSIEALVGVPLERCMDRGPPDGASFPFGCLMPTRTRYRGADGREAGTPTELAHMLAPIETPARALALVALLYPEIPDPTWVGAPGEAFQFEAIPGAPPAFEVVADGTGFIVRAAAGATCGCVHHLVRLAFAVGRDGCVTRLDEPLTPIAWAQPICGD